MPAAPATRSAARASSRRRGAAAGALATALLLAGCASSPSRRGPVSAQPPLNASSGCFAPPPNLRAAYNRDYTVLGHTYAPLRSAEGYDIDGTASWYGWESGATTSMGTRVNPRAFTAASRVLPLPTCVEVTNLRNGRSALVLVDDRGPFVDSRVMDLSYGAAKALGVVATGTAPVRIVALAADTLQTSPGPLAAPPPPLPAAAAPQTRFPRAPTPSVASAPAPAGSAAATPAMQMTPLPALTPAAQPVPAPQPAPAEPTPPASSATASLSDWLAQQQAAASAALAAQTPAQAPALTQAPAPTATPASASLSAAEPPAPATSASLPPPAALAPMPGGAAQTYVQTGAFTIEGNARLEASRLQRAGVGPVEVVPGFVRGRTWYKVQIGPLPGSGNEPGLRSRLAALGLRDYTFVHQ